MAKICIPCQFAEHHPLGYCPICGRPYSEVTLDWNKYWDLLEKSRQLHYNTIRLNASAQNEGWYYFSCHCKLSLWVQEDTEETTCKDCKRRWRIDFGKYHVHLIEGEQ